MQPGSKVSVGKTLVSMSQKTVFLFVLDFLMSISNCLKYAISFYSKGLMSLKYVSVDGIQLDSLTSLSVLSKA